MADQSARSNVYNEEGRIEQTENAILSVNNAGTSMAIVCSNGILLAGHNISKNDDILEKIVQIDENIFAIFSGIYGDALQIINLLRDSAQNHLEKYDTPISISELSMKASHRLQRFTQLGGQRPFGCSFLLCTYEEEEYQIFSLDPSGNFNKCLKKCFGKHSERFNSAFKSNVEISSSVENATSEVFKLIKETIECPKSAAIKFEIMNFKKNEKKVLNLAEIEDLIENS